MRHRIEVTIEAHELTTLKRGGSLELAVGDQALILRLEETRRRASSGVCSYCKRDLRVAKHSRNCKTYKQQIARRRNGRRP